MRPSWHPHRVAISNKQVEGRLLNFHCPVGQDMVIQKDKSRTLSTLINADWQEWLALLGSSEKVITAEAVASACLDKLVSIVLPYDFPRHWENWPR